MLGLRVRPRVRTRRRLREWRVSRWTMRCGELLRRREKRRRGRRRLWRAVRCLPDRAALLARGGLRERGVHGKSLHGTGVRRRRDERRRDRHRLRRVVFAMCAWGRVRRRAGLFELRLQWRPLCRCGLLRSAGRERRDGGWGVLDRLGRYGTRRAVVQSDDPRRGMDAALRDPPRRHANRRHVGVHHALRVDDLRGSTASDARVGVDGAIDR